MEILTFLRFFLFAYIYLSGNLIRRSTQSAYLLSFIMHVNVIVVVLVICVLWFCLVFVVCAHEVTITNEEIYNKNIIITEWHVKFIYLVRIKCVVMSRHLIIVESIMNCLTIKSRCIFCFWYATNHNNVIGVNTNFRWCGFEFVLINMPCSKWCKVRENFVMIFSQIEQINRARHSISNVMMYHSPQSISNCWLNLRHRRFIWSYFHECVSHSVPFI